jgi:hypothetical protein
MNLQLAEEFDYQQNRIAGVNYRCYKERGEEFTRGSAKTIPLRFTEEACKLPNADGPALALNLLSVNECRFLPGEP